KDALKYLERYNVFEESGAKNYSCFLLPFWLGKTFPLAPEVCRRISLANLFGFFYFLVQDAVMDAPTGESEAQLLPLGNLFLLDFINGYREMFPSESLFWSLLGKYFTQWAESVKWERREHWRGGQPVSEADLLMVAGKSAPLKITCAAVAIQNRSPESIESLDQMVDQLLITSQLLDDYADWRHDLATGNCTFFLSQVMAACQVTDFRLLNEDHVQQAVYFRKVLEKINAILVKNHGIIQSSGIKVPYLVAFHENLLGSFRNAMIQVREQKTRMLEGGFSCWLHENYPDSRK
ncbi:MAG TPA: class 1 isoprenoid biosynthesis enzyme, partial [Bacillota bacterium]|nr:class 1 isoprenoid biosynthesis enzyme [Bacillota bacterium]